MTAMRQRHLHSHLSFRPVALAVEDVVGVGVVDLVERGEERRQRQRQRREGDKKEGASLIRVAGGF